MADYSIAKVQVIQIKRMFEQKVLLRGDQDA